jgi:hypothetical protein
MHLCETSPAGYEALLLRGPDISDVKVPKFRLDEHEGEPEIRCPLCHWQPRASSKWFCAFCPHPEGLLGGCGTMWNTFATHGRCPGCQHQWRWTSCLACAGWSLHRDWYVDRKE